MNTIEFKRILKVFADHPEDVEIKRDEGIVQIQNQLVQFHASQRDGQLFISENGTEFVAEKWIANRIANLPMLARRIVEATPVAECFVSPNAFFIDTIEANPTDSDVPIDDAISHLSSIVANGSAFSSYTLYLTAEAGEGKTTLINEIARRQAEKYLARESDRLIVPIQLGGRSFLRLDDMIIGSIANNYKFRGLYIDSLIELIKCGFIVPAFDGFEEMFVVGSSGEAVSSLGNLLSSLDSMGVLIVSARTAYFEIRDFDTQARLFDGLKKGENSFARLKLVRWSRMQFEEYWTLRGLPNFNEIYSSLVEKLGSDQHPLLTRAVLVKRLADIASDAPRFDRLLQRISATSSTYFSDLVNSILEREIESKWVDRAENGVQRPLISIEQHHHLLSMVAIEMVMTSTSLISHDELRVLTELFCDSQRLSPQISRQVLERIDDHPLLSKSDSNSNSIRFDHEEFKDFFFGEAIGSYVREGSMVDVQTVLRKSVISHSAVDSCVGFIIEKCDQPIKVIEFLQGALSSDGPTSYAWENGSRLIVSIMQKIPCEGVMVKDAYINPESFIGAKFNGVTFEKCFFRIAVFKSCSFENCIFSRCVFDGIEIYPDAQIENCTIDEHSLIHSVSFPETDTVVFSPDQVARDLVAAGFTLDREKIVDSDHEAVEIEDDLLVIVNRALRAFHRSTAVNESTFKLRLGKAGNDFEELVLPRLLSSGILVHDTYRGSGTDRRFRLGVKMSDIEDALRSSKGSFTDFVSAFESGR